MDCGPLSSEAGAGPVTVPCPPSVLISPPWARCPGCCRATAPGATWARVMTTMSDRADVRADAGWGFDGKTKVWPDLHRTFLYIVRKNRGTGRTKVQVRGLWPSQNTVIVAVFVCRENFFSRQKRHHDHQTDSHPTDIRRGQAVPTPHTPTARADSGRSGAGVSRKPEGQFRPAPSTFSPDSKKRTDLGR